MKIMLLLFFPISIIAHESHTEAGTASTCLNNGLLPIAELTRPACDCESQTAKAEKPQTDTIFITDRERKIEGRRHNNTAKAEKPQTGTIFITYRGRRIEGRRHENGGGFVALTAQADDSAYIGPHSKLLDNAKALENAVLRDTVLTGNNVLRGNAVSEGYTYAGRLPGLNTRLPRTEGDLQMEKLSSSQPSLREFEYAEYGLRLRAEFYHPSWGPILYY